MIRELGESIESAVLETVGRTVGRAQERRPLPVDLLEDEDAYLAVFDAPGANQSDVQVRYDDGAVLVRVDRFRTHYQDYEMQFPGRGLSLDGRVELPDDARIDPTGSSATLKDDGTLHVMIPKRDDDGSDSGDEPADAEDTAEN